MRGGALRGSVGLTSSEGPAEGRVPCGVAPTLVRLPGLRLAALNATCVQPRFRACADVPRQAGARARGRPAPWPRAMRARGRPAPWPPATRARRWLVPWPPRRQRGRLPRAQYRLAEHLAVGHDVPREQGLADAKQASRRYRFTASRARPRISRTKTIAPMLGGRAHGREIWSGAITREVSGRKRRGSLDRGPLGWLGCAAERIRR